MFYGFLFLLIYTVSSLLFGNTLLCEGVEGLPCVTQYSDLHITDNFVSAINSLKGLAGVYCIRCVVTGAMYIGSSINLSKRMNEHFICSTNSHLRNALNKYGIIAFVFIVVEYVELLAESSLASIKLLLLEKEQIYLNWLFSQPKDVRYNFATVAGSTLGLKHTAETKAKVSAAMKGKSRGASHGMFGLVSPRAVPVFIFNLDGT